jgi:hypothetical protein
MNLNPPWSAVGGVHLVTTYFGHWLCMRQIGNQNLRNFFLAWDENLFFRQLRNDSKNPRIALQDV